MNQWDTGKVENSYGQDFWSRVETGSEDECWPWKAGCFTRGYGSFKPIGGKQQYAHRVAYELTHGPIPKGQIIMHTCDNVKCVNPAHLRAGMQGENIMDAVNKGRWMSEKRDEAIKNQQRDRDGRWSAKQPWSPSMIRDYD